MSDESVPKRVDQACDRFEKAWNEGQAPRIEDYLAEVPEPDRLPLFREMLALEMFLPGSLLVLAIRSRHTIRTLLVARPAIVGTGCAPRFPMARVVGYRA
jgi:hypothetical protein